MVVVRAVEGAEACLCSLTAKIRDEGGLGRGEESEQSRDAA
jgi:hypothetical protein